MDLVEFLKTENLAFKRKLQSKSEALHILQSQLQCCHQELEQYRRKSNQGLHNLKSSSNISLSELTNNSRSNENTGQTASNGSHVRIREGFDFERLKSFEVANKKLSDEKKLLQFDVEDLKQKLNDANSDILMLRRQHSHMRLTTPVVEKVPNTLCTQHLDQLEHLNVKYSQLEQDLQILLDEKQDLIKQRDIYYDKMQRLNIQIRNLLNISNQNVDFDAIVMENKYLKQRLEDVLNEKKLWNKTVSKYKNMLSNNCQNTGKVLSYDQIAKHINSMTIAKDQSNLRQICITLLETLNEKNLLLQHQRKTNKVLASRILELESESGRNKTCDVLMDGYSATGGEMPCDIDEVELKEKVEQWKERLDTFRESNKIDNTELQKQINIDLNGVDVLKESNSNDKNLIRRCQSLSDESIGDESAKSIDESIETIDTNSEEENIRKESNENVNETRKSIDRSSFDEKEIQYKEFVSKSIENKSVQNTFKINDEVISDQTDVEQPQIKHSVVTDYANDHGDLKEDIRDKVIKREVLFQEHEDIQNLPVELQKLVLEAMKDLEKDELKCL